MSVTTDIAFGAQCIERGGVVAYPTEAVYGLGCDPTCSEAIKKILLLKSRNANKGLILVASDWQQIEPYIGNLTQSMYKRVNASWPGPVTWILPADTAKSALIRGAYSTIAVRISSHPVVSALCSACGHALISTSANVSGNAGMINPQDVYDTFGDALCAIVSGELGTLPSATPIFNAGTGQQIR